jgi:hypothetical protein
VWRRRHCDAATRSCGGKECGAKPKLLAVERASLPGDEDRRQRQRQAFEHTLGDGFNQILHWSRLPDWHNQPLTPNPDTIYFMPCFDTTG